MASSQEVTLCHYGDLWGMRRRDLAYPETMQHCWIHDTWRGVQVNPCELLDQASRACRTVAPTFRLVPNRGNPWIFHMIPDAFLIPNTLWVFSESCGLSFRTNFLNCEFRIPCLHLFLKHHRSAASSFEKIWKAELLLFCMFLWWFLMILRFGSKNLQRVDSKNRRGSSQNDSRLWELCLTLQVWYCGVCFLWNQVNTQHSVIYIYTLCI